MGWKADRPKIDTKGVQHGSNMGLKMVSGGPMGVMSQGILLNCFIKVYPPRSSSSWWFGARGGQPPAAAVADCRGGVTPPRQQQQLLSKWGGLAPLSNNCRSQAGHNPFAAVLPAGGWCLGVGELTRGVSSSLRGPGGVNPPRSSSCQLWVAGGGLPPPQQQQYPILASGGVNHMQQQLLFGGG